MRLFFVLLFFGTLGAMTPQQALQRLKEGNARFVSSSTSSFYMDYPSVRTSLKEKQEPFAIILGCSDSRVPPEIIFDATLGKLFVVRVAGNVAGPLEFDSVNFAVGVLKSPLLVVLGHQNCGAVSAVLQGKDSAIPAVAAKVRPALPNMTISLEEAIKDNVRYTCENIRSKPQIKSLIDKGELDVLGAYYCFETGKVIFLK
jgi:carbonic anhydrase